MAPDRADQWPYSELSFTKQPVDDFPRIGFAHTLANVLDLPLLRFDVCRQRLINDPGAIALGCGGQIPVIVR